MKLSQVSAVLFGVVLGGCIHPSGAEEGPDASGPSMGEGANEVVEAPGASGVGFGDPARATNGVRGGGDHAGGQDVYSLGLPPGENTSLTLRWSERRVMNGPGADFVVFENGFRQRGSDAHFMDLMVVQLSLDAERWVSFPHDYITVDEHVFVADPEAWQGFAGRWPTLLHEETNPVDPFWTERAGGDPFDLDELPDDGGLATRIRNEGFVYIRLVAAPALMNPDTGEPFARMAISDGPDIDGVVARYIESL